MKILKLTLGAALLLAAIPALADVIQLPGRIEVEGVLDGSSGVPGVRGDTMDYLTFEVLTLGSVTFTSGFNSAFRLYLASFIGVEDEFGYLGHPNRLEQTPSMPLDFFTRTLDPGIYVTAMGMRENTSYDVFDGYKPVNEEGGGFTFGPYAYTIEGPVRALEFREGNLDGTFTITQIPEPRTLLLLIASMATLAGRRRKSVRGG
jgi:hypothetical protein